VITIKKVSSKNSEGPSIRPALTPEARENQMIYLATELAEKQLKDGTASSQVITHYLKLATAEMKKKNELLEMQAKLAAAKIQSLESAKEIEEMYKEAIKAMTHYQGHDYEEEDVSEDDK